MLRRCGSALLGGVHRATARQASGTARDVVAAVSELRLPEKLAGREKVGGAATAAADLPLDRVPVQLAPYQALPVDGRITRHFTRGLPVIDPASRTPEVCAQAGANCGGHRRPAASLLPWRVSVVGTQLR